MIQFIQSFSMPVRTYKKVFSLIDDDVKGIINVHFEPGLISNGEILNWVETGSENPTFIDREVLERIFKDPSNEVSIYSLHIEDQVTFKVKKNDCGIPSNTIFKYNITSSSAYSRVNNTAYVVKLGLIRYLIRYNLIESWSKNY